MFSTKSPTEVGTLNRPRQSNCEQRSARGSVLGGERPTVLADYAMRECQTYAMSFGLGGEKGNEDLLQVSGLNAGAGILNRDRHPFVSGRVALQ